MNDHRRNDMSCTGVLATLNINNMSTAFLKDLLLSQFLAISGTGTESWAKYGVIIDANL